MTMHDRPEILIVEDDVLVRETLRAVLEENEYKVLVAGDGEAAKSVLGLTRPNLVLSDIRMPKCNGFELLEYVRSLATLRDIPFIFMSAKSEQSDVRTGMALGADDYLVKPFPPNEVIRVVSTRLQRAGRMKQALLQQEKFLARYLPHELRTPLNGVLGYADLMLEMAASGTGLSLEETKEFGEAISISGNRLLSLTENLLLLLELDRVPTDQLKKDIRKIDGPVWLAGLTNEISAVVDRYGRQDDIVQNIQASSIRTTSSLFPRVFGHLVDNACKFSLPGTPIKILGFEEAKGYRLTVSDRGQGMKVEQMVKRGSFQQFDRETKEQQGLGLGLEICRRYADHHAVDFTIMANQEGPGITVGFSLHGP